MLLTMSYHGHLRGLWGSELKGIHPPLFQNPGSAVACHTPLGSLHSAPLGRQHVQTLFLKSMFAYHLNQSVLIRRDRLKFRYLYFYFLVLYIFCSESRNQLKGVILFSTVFFNMGLLLAMINCLTMLT